MNKGISVIDILIGFLVLALILGVLAVAYVIIAGIQDVFQGFGETETTGVSKPSVDSSGTGSSASTDAIGSTSKGHVLKLGDNGLNDAVIASYTNNGGIDGYYYGYYTYELKANTKYRVLWTVEPRVQYLKNVSIPKMVDNGSSGYYFLLNTSYSLEKNLDGQKLCSSQLSNLLDFSWEFTTENEGNTVTFFMFYVRLDDSVTTQADADLIGIEALKCVESITFEEIVEG